MTPQKQYPKWLVDAVENSDPLPMDSFLGVASDLEDLVEQLRALEPAIRIMASVTPEKALAAFASRGLSVPPQFQQKG